LVKKKKDDEFYYCKITEKEKPNILNYNLAIKAINWDFAENNYRFLITYKDVEDNKTMVMILFYYNDEDV